MNQLSDRSCIGVWRGGRKLLKSNCSRERQGGQFKAEAAGRVDLIISDITVHSCIILSQYFSQWLSLSKANLRGLFLLIHHCHQKSSCVFFFSVRHRSISHSWAKVVSVGGLCVKTSRGSTWIGCWGCTLSIWEILEKERPCFKLWKEMSPCWF